ncbi:CrcB protein [Paenibacillus phyllosphaerae]|uniref:Fluoride-specific ion channel FluC n=1 Tax=Paenibacillus phyllosphaerae TaxID=274593 RepID=A0A7W5B597_9BACL|nr:fluoride efflux transporter CrcB [Paenibacillus phyllosphaerae]MBB3114414.1 CrcB protein [Paenibacillus phyllosphaerae]
MNVRMAIVIGGALGALSRYGLSRLFPYHLHGAWPWATFICNITGSFALGLLFAAVVRYGLSSIWREAIGTGFIGAYTTFSAFSLEVFQLFRDGAIGVALMYSAGSMLMAAVAAAVGPVLLPPRMKEEA